MTEWFRRDGWKRVEREGVDGVAWSSESLVRKRCMRDLLGGGCLKES